MSTTTISRQGRTVALAAATIAMTIAPAAPAGASAAKLSVNRYLPGTYTVSVDGVFTMTQGQAQGLINNGYRIEYRLWGDDTDFDDLLLGPIFLTRPPGGLSATPLGLEFHRFGHLRGSQLNEDDSFFDRHDELYAVVTLKNSTGTAVRAFGTNHVEGYF